MSYQILSLPKYLKQHKAGILAVFSKPEPANFDLNAWKGYFNADQVLCNDLDIIFKKCRNSIKRNDVVQLAKSAASLTWTDIRLFFLAIMIWGYGDWQLGKIYTRNILADKTTKNIMGSAIKSVSLMQIENAYQNFRLPYFRSAYFTKFLYFIGSALNSKPLPLILDSNVAKCLDHIDSLGNMQLLNTFAYYNRDKKTGRVASVNGYLNGYMSYIYSLDSWANQLGCAADAIECFLYDHRGRSSYVISNIETTMNRQQPIILPSHKQINRLTHIASMVPINSHTTNPPVIKWPVTIRGRLGLGQGINQREFQITTLAKIEACLPSNDPSNPYCVTASTIKGRKNLGRTVKCMYKNNKVEGQYHRSLKAGIWIGSDFSHSGKTATDAWKDFTKHFNITGIARIPVFIDFYLDRIIIRKLDNVK